MKIHFTQIQNPHLRNTNLKKQLRNHFPVLASRIRVLELCKNALYSSGWAATWFLSSPQAPRTILMQFVCSQSFNIKVSKHCMHVLIMSNKIYSISGKLFTLFTCLIVTRTNCFNKIISVSAYLSDT